MKRLIAMMMVLASNGLAASWYTVSTNVDGSAKEKWLTIQALPHTLGVNEYPADYPFPTNNMVYWKKVGGDWVSMNSNEMAQVDVKLKQDETRRAVGDVDLDALFALIAHMSTQKDRDYTYVTNYFCEVVSVEKIKKRKDVESKR